jgi:hypothetical protein
MVIQEVQSSTFRFVLPKEQAKAWTLNYWPPT